MVTHGPSTEGAAARQRDKATGQRLSDLRVRGGQGRGRTADLPIFRTWKGVREVRPDADSCSTEGLWVLSCPPGARLLLANPLAGLGFGSPSPAQELVGEI